MAGTIDAKEDWTKRQLIASAQQGWRATRYFNVANATNEAQALGAAGIPKINELHPLSSLLICLQLQTDFASPNFALVTVTYGQNTGQQQDNTNPLKAAPKIKWKIGNSNEKMDQDIYGNPIWNTAGFPLTEGASRENASVFLTITRNEPYFDVQKSLAFQNTVNKAPWAPVGLPVVLPGQARCVSITPTAEYTRTVKYLPIAYEFELRNGIGWGNTPPQPDQDGFYDGFKICAISQGKRAWYIDPNPAAGQQKYASGPIIDSKGNQVNEDVLLDELGIPISLPLSQPYMVAKIMTGDKPAGQMTPQLSPLGPLAFGKTVVVQKLTGFAGAKSVIIKYVRYRSADFNSFNLV